MKASVFLSVLFVVITVCNATNARNRVGSYGCEIVGSEHPVRAAWEDLQRRSDYGESCRLQHIKRAIVNVTEDGCIGIMLSNRIGLAATTCVMQRNRKGTCDLGDGYQVIRHQHYLFNIQHRPKHDIAVFHHYKASESSDLNCVKTSCTESTMCKIIRRDGTALGVSLAYCTHEDHPDSDIDVSRHRPNYCHTMCVKGHNNESIPSLSGGSPLVCKNESRLHEDEWFIRGIISFKKTGRDDYAMAAMIDMSVIKDTTCDCPSY